MPQEISVAKVIEKLPGRFVRENAEDFTATFQFLLEDEQDFFIQVADQACEIKPGEHPDPDVTLIMEAATMIEVINGEKDGMSAFLSGKLRAEGNIMLATKLGKLFSREKQS
ncbi:SCP2 sterol-binding domain-containing protein [Neptuniibacter halophilus]|uniref:SCP2 sterol-binding domain-containing protein n=1 Tax=Neptuniibacter halophilus TaxID=651666 RepID=UPI002573EB66|nr:SCP2 sterol-binding domain-containing protein [Neptuniibacter halophilus]